MHFQLPRRCLNSHVQHPPPDPVSHTELSVLPPQPIGSPLCFLTQKMEPPSTPWLKTRNQDISLVPCFLHTPRLLGHVSGQPYALNKLSSFSLSPRQSLCSENRCLCFLCDSLFPALSVLILSPYGRLASFYHRNPITSVPLLKTPQHLLPAIGTANSSAYGHRADTLSAAGWVSCTLASPASSRGFGKPEKAPSTS